MKELSAVPSEPLVSIVTPSRNQGDYLAEMLMSLEAQTYRRFEHIVIDSCSTDGTASVLEEHRERFDLRWVSEPDEGMYEAINKGLRMARGDILAYLATDDAYLPWTLETVVDAFRADPGAGVVLGDIVSVFDDTLQGELRTNPRFDAGYLQRFFCLGQPAVFFRREVFDATGGFDERLKVVGDCEFWMRVAEDFRGVKVSEVLAIDRIRSESKRIVDDSLGAQEIDRIRAPYRPANAIVRAVTVAIDRARYTTARRLSIASLAGAEIRRRLGLSGRGRWPRFVGSEIYAGSSLRALCLATLPRIGQRWERRILQLRAPRA